MQADDKQADDKQADDRNAMGHGLAARDWLARARAWLDGLQTPAGPRASSAEGHFHAVFGRDTLWSALLALEAARVLPHDPELGRWATQLAARGLRALATTQGTVDDDEIEEQPGKIVHEYWPEPPAHLLRQQWPLRAGRYYGSADATYLYLMTAAAVWEHAQDGRALVLSLWQHVLAALRWTLEYGDVDGDGLMEMRPRQPHGRGLSNQVWKDSRDPLRQPDGSLPPPPIAWVELQGYAIAAFRGMAALLRERDEDPALQRELAQRVARIQHGLDQFWLPAEGCPAVALDRQKAPIPQVTSNVGHLLWCGALAGDRAEAAATRLLAPDLLTRWGLRTLSERSATFDPCSYHRGSVWPFDNAIAAGGFWRLGRRADARRIGRGVIGALDRFGTPVELYCVLSAAQVRAPNLVDAELLLEYPGACAVQAWSAAGLLLCAAQLSAED